MPVLFNPDGSELTDANVRQLKTGQTCIDSTLGECIVRGTVPLDRGLGVNVLIDWLGPNANDKPPSRGTEHLTIKSPSGGGGTTTIMHTGAKFESGAVHEQRGRNDADAGELIRDRCTGSRSDALGSLQVASSRPLEHTRRAARALCENRVQNAHQARPLSK